MVAVAIIISIIIIIYCYLTAPHIPAPKGCAVAFGLPVQEEP